MYSRFHPTCHLAWNWVWVEKVTFDYYGDQIPSVCFYQWNYCSHFFLIGPRGKIPLAEKWVLFLLWRVSDEWLETITQIMPCWASFVSWSRAQMENSRLQAKSKIHGMKNRPVWITTGNGINGQDSINNYVTKVVSRETKLPLMFFAAQPITRGLFHEKTHQDAHPNDHPHGASFREFEQM